MEIKRAAPFFAAAAFVLPLISPSAHAQSVVPVGAGSYAGQVPAANYYADSYYGLPAAQMEPLTSGTAFFNLLHIDPSLSGTAIPSNHWWTDLLIANRSNLPAGASQYVIQQDPYGGNMWFYPGMLAPRSYGLDLYFPNSWTAPNSNGSPQGAIDQGPALSIYGDVPYHIPSGDILIADFENGYPAGTVRVGTGFAATPSSGSGLTGMMGNYCANTRDGGNNATGELELPDFTVQKHYLNFLICGGTWSSTQVRLIVSGTAVLAASGQNSTTFNWVTWDISPWAGQAAHVEIADESTGSWGIIACDQIVESDSSSPSGRFGGNLIASKSVVTNWGDWNVDFKLPDALGNEVDVTMARGIPFTWTTWKGMNPKMMVSGATLYDVNNNPVTTGTGFTAGAFAFNYQGRTYGVFLPDSTAVTMTSSYIEPQLSGSNNYMVMGYLPSTSYLGAFAAQAYARPTNTRLDWSLDLPDGLVNTTWAISTAPLKGTNLSTIQGWLPHHYRTTTNNLAFTPYTYLTPRGTMQCAIGNSFQISFPFKGIVPVLPEPVATGTLANDFQPARMTGYLNNFQPGTMIGDTYWSGKAMALCAQYMAWANQMEDTGDFQRLQGALETAMKNWLTYTPGEQNAYFALYPNFHAIIGWDASYGTQCFNDLHFHYGYFAVTGAILGMFDQQFLADYGPMLKMLVKCYGNWDRTDNSEPFFRTFDIWEGHSNAGGTSSPNGENQESSSEAMQSWAGMYLLGSGLNDSAMTAAGAMGFAMESAAVNEYWQDLYQTNFPGGYNRAGNGILEANAYAYGTYFSGDPAWVYGIQYTPSNHWNNYLSRYQHATVAAKYQAMWNERAAWCAGFPMWSSTGAFTAGEWVQYNQRIYSVSGTTSITGSGGNPAADTAQWTIQADCTKSAPDVFTGGLDHVLLSYQGLWDHDNAAAEFDQYYAAGESISTNNSDSGATYYLIHSSRMLGDQDYNYTTSIPGSAVYLNAATGIRTYTVYNPQSNTAPAIVYNNGLVTGTMTIPGMALVSSTNPNYVPGPPLTPASLQAISGYGTVSLTWSPCQGATSYNIKRASASGGPYMTIGSASAAGYADASATAGSSYFYVVSAVNSIGESGNSVEAAANVTGLPAAAINCGGGAVTPFGADTGYTGGSTSNTTATEDVTGVASPAPQAVYQSYRFGNFTYAVTGLAPKASYIARLHFAENYWTAAGKRVFNVSLSGSQVLTNYDIYAMTGAKDRAVVQEMPVVSDSNGQLLFSFATVKDNAACCGIEIRQSLPAAPGGLGAASGTGSVILSWAAVPGATTYNVARSAASGGPYQVIANSGAAGFTDATVSPGLKYYYVVAALNAGGAGANSMEVSGTSLLNPLQQWRQNNFGITAANDPVAGDTAIPQGDGVPNLVKYALGLSPKAPAVSGLPQGTVAGGAFGLTFTRMKAATDITYHVQASSDLSSWTEIWSSNGVAYGGGANLSQQMTITDTAGVQWGRRFLRLSISSP